MQTAPTPHRDFHDQNIYVGIDVHDKSWKIHIFSDEFELKSWSQEPDVDRLSHFLHKQYQGGNYLVAYESGFSGFWIQRAFQARGINCQVVHAADVPTNNKEQLRKSDSVDSKKIAKGLKNGDLNFVHVPDLSLELDRQLVRSRLTLSKDTTRIKNRIKALLQLHGLMIPATIKHTNWSGKFIEWLQQQDFGSRSGNLSMCNLVDELQFMESQKKKVDQSIKALSQTPGFSGNVTLLKSIPSIGPLTSMILLTELGAMSRFKRFDDLCSYCGLAPDCHESGETKQSGMSRRGNAHIKNILVECAWVAVRKDPALLLYYKEQLVKMKPQKAIIKVSRKLLSRIRYVLMNQTPYELGIIK